MAQGKWVCSDCETEVRDDGSCSNADCRRNALKWSNKTGKADHPEDDGVDRT